MQYPVRILLVAVFTFVCNEMARANNLNLSWSPSPSPNLAGYRVYYGTSSGSYSYQIDAGNATSEIIPNLAPGTTYYIAATAYDAAGNESPVSDEMSYTVPAAGAPTKMMPTMSPGIFGEPREPGSFQFLAQTGHWYEVQATSDLVNWAAIWRSGVFSADASMDFVDPDGAYYSQRYYRLLIH